MSPHPTRMGFFFFFPTDPGALKLARCDPRRHEHPPRPWKRDRWGVCSRGRRRSACDFSARRALSSTRPRTKNNFTCGTADDSGCRHLDFHRLSPTRREKSAKGHSQSSALVPFLFPVCDFRAGKRDESRTREMGSGQVWRWKNFRVPHGMHLVSPINKCFSVWRTIKFYFSKVFFRQLNDPRPVMKRETRDGRRAARRALGICSGEPRAGTENRASAMRRWTGVTRACYGDSIRYPSRPGASPRRSLCERRGRPPRQSFFFAAPRRRGVS